jgi:hypothetical protein
VQKPSKPRFSDANITLSPQIPDRIWIEEFFKDWKCPYKEATIETFQKWSLRLLREAKCCRLPILFPTTSHAHCASRMNVDERSLLRLPCFATLGHYHISKRYPCKKCKKMFRGTDIKSMELDKSGVVRAVFRFHILRRCCVSEDLFLDIVKRPLESTNSIYKHLRDIAAQKFINDVIEFLLQLKYDNVAAESSMQIKQYLVDTSSHATTSASSVLRPLLLYYQSKSSAPAS